MNQKNLNYEIETDEPRNFTDIFRFDYESKESQLWDWNQIQAYP